MTIRLQDWNVILPPMVSHLSSPDMRQASLTGQVHGHANTQDFPDGTKVITTGIIAVDHKTVKTASGNLYELGDPSPRFLELLAPYHLVFDPENPLAGVHIDVNGH